MKKTVLILSLLAFLLGGWVAALWLLPSAVYKGDCQEIRYGVNEGLELVEQDTGEGIYSQPEDRLEILGIPHHAPSYDGRHLRRHPPAAIQERPLRRRRLSLSALGFPQPVHATHPRAHLATGRNRT